MNNNYKELNIQKSLYRGCGESFAERLEKMDPTENYRGTELGHLDAFQRQLKRFDIQVGGSHSSMLEKFFQNGQSAVLFPEYLMRAIRQGMEENDPLSSIVAARTLISATDYRGLTTNDDLEADVTNEAAALSTTTISLKDKTTALKKRGRMLRASYEAIKFQRLDLFTLALRRIGAEIARCQMKDAVDVLVNGDGNANAAEKLKIGTSPMIRMPCSRIYARSAFHWRKNRYCVKMQKRISSARSSSYRRSTSSLRRRRRSSSSHSIQGRMPK